ncbi:MAG: 3-methyl-2-oxobutanoate hydroxymethyltransferase [Sandaracinaceae bacterium]|nr:3-methyl-2-oxobutanoate hydroxymethyltransferase [Sandaracinaceae bacterium]
MTQSKRASGPDRPGVPGVPATQPAARPPKVTVPMLRAMKRAGDRISVATAYDATFARMLDESGVDVLLVGDSLGMVVQGLDTTLPVTLDEMLYHTRAVARGLARASAQGLGGRALVVGDMPFMTYQVDEITALRNAGRFLAEGGAHAVKLEGGVTMAKTIARIVESGIPVMGHVGLTPQSVHAMGGFRVQGKSEEDAERVLRDAKAVEEAGAFAVVLEGIPEALAARITRELEVPTIGIGAGVSCDGQVLVSYDFLGLTPDLKPKFVKRFAELYRDGVEASRRYVEEVKAGTFPAKEHTFGARVETPAGAATAPTGGYGPREA